MELSLKEMVQNAVHFGHPTQKWNPKMRPYIYGSRNGIHIFDLKKTADCLVRALEFLHEGVQQKKTILFVGTKPQCRTALFSIQKNTGMPIVTDKWMPGLLTNFSTIKKRIDYFKTLKEEDRRGEFGKYTKKEQSQLRKKIQELSASFSGVESMEKIPDVVFASDLVRDQIAVKEARRLHIPVVAIVDTNADPDYADYVIPANDDAVKSVNYVLTLVEKAMTSKSKS